MPSDGFIARYRNQQPEWGFNGLGYVVYKRTYARLLEDGTTEEWWQTCQRVVEGLQSIGAGWTEDEAEEMYDAMFHLRAMFGGRVLWQAGTANNDKLGGDSMVNCWATELRDPVSDFSFLFDELMLGGGVGFSVRRMDLGQLPRVQGRDLVRHHPANDTDFIVPDSREGWVELLRQVMRAYFVTGRPLTYSTVLIRPAGSPIRGFGGTATGPDILIDGIAQITKLLDSAAGRRPRPVEALDISNLIGYMVVAGNVRRSAEIAIGDPDDLSYLRAKRWDLQELPTWRRMSNNSVQLSEMSELPQEFWEGYEGNGEPYGMFHLDACRTWGRMGERRSDPSVTLPNPCGEIGLADKEPCILAELILPRLRSRSETHRLAGLLYKGQKAVAALPFLHPETQEIVGQNRRLGLSVTGVMQASQLQLGWMAPVYESLRELDARWSAERGWPESVKLTTVKPSGTLSLLAGVTPGVHPGFAQYHIRRVRMAAMDPMVRWSTDRGYQVEEAVGDRDTVIVEFPCEFPKGTVLAEGLKATQQMDWSRRLQRDWADNAVSCTVYYSRDELPEIQGYLKDNWDRMKTISFLLREDHGFTQAPMEELTEAEYRHRLNHVSPLVAASGDTTTVDLMDGCDEGMCPVR